MLEPRGKHRVIPPNAPVHPASGQPASTFGRWALVSLLLAGLSLSGCREETANVASPPAAATATAAAADTAPAPASELASLVDAYRKISA